MKKLLSLMTVSLSCTTVGAQAINFEGLSAAVNINSLTTNSAISVLGSDFLNGVGQQSWKGSLQMAYGFSVSPSAVVSAGGTYTIGSVDAGSSVNSFAIKLKNSYSIYLEPSFLINDKTLAYAKLSYEAGSGTMALSGWGDRSRSIRGVGLGAGVRTMITKASFVQVEFRQVNYNRIDAVSDGPFSGTSIKSKATFGTVGLGIKF